MIKVFDDMCSVLEESGCHNPKGLTTLEFYQKLERLERINKKRK